MESIGLSSTYQLFKLAANVTGIPLAGGSGRKADDELAGIDADIAFDVLRRRLIAEMVEDAYKKGEGRRDIMKEEVQAARSAIISRLCSAAATTRPYGVQMTFRGPPMPATLRTPLIGYFKPNINSFNSRTPCTTVSD